MFESTHHPSHEPRDWTLPRLGFLFTTVVFALGLWGQAKPRPVQIAPSAARQIQVLKAIKSAKGPQQNKMDSRLYLALLSHRKDPQTALLPDFRFIKPEADGRVPVDVILVDRIGMKPVLQKLETLDEVVRGKSATYRRVSARVRLENLEELAAMPEVLRVRQAIPALTQVLNVSEGDKTHGADEARGFFGAFGAGVKIGVISDGVDSLASVQSSGDLPPVVDVLSGQAGSGDEGTAMLEIVHDLAPSADLAFATALPSEAQFAQNILDLAAAGCDIIVDDIIYLDESPFQDGPVAQAVNTVTASGVLYFSSAGNEGNADDLTAGTWEGDFLASAAADPGPLAGANLHDFGDGGNSILVEFGGGNPPLLIWAEHYDLATGNASTDFDIYDMNGALTTIFDASTDVQDGVGGDDFPIEFIGGGTFGGERLLIDKFAAGATSSVPMMNLIVFRGELDDSLVTGGATRGHSAAVDAFSVAATPADASLDGISADGPFPGLFTGANESEDFTSDGPRRIILTAAGVEITPGNRTSTGGEVRQKPDITAADGVSTATAGFSPFYGTSAAAPHAAAIAALMKSAAPAATPAQIRTAIISSAIDIESAGTDRDTGAGIIMPHAALVALGATPAAFLDDGTPALTEVLGDGDAFVEPNEIFDVVIPLTNVGGSSATAISAVLSSPSAGVAVLVANSAYPNLAALASAGNTTSYRIRIGSAALCGGTIQLTLTVTYTGGTSPQVFDNFKKLGEAGTPATFSFTGPPVAIPDAADLSGSNPGAAVNANVNVAALPGPVYDIDFRFDGTACSNAAGSTTVGLDHTFVNDLHVTLTSPGATSVLIMNDPDGSGNNFCQTVLDDESGGSSIQAQTSGSAPFTGSFLPNAPLSAFDAGSSNGMWTLTVQDFFSGDTGNIRAFSLIITPAICNAPALTNNVTATKTAAGTFVVGGTVTYTVVLTNNGGLDQGNNPGNEFLDTLPAGLTLVSANATSGTAVATIGTNTVSWNGSIPALSSVTITITATINAGVGGTTISNQGQFFFDVDGNGTNESLGVTDNPGTGTANDATGFLALGLPLDVVTKTVSGPFTTGSNVVYTIVITNNGDGASPDNPGNELTDVLPSSLTLVSANATAGTAVATIGTNTVTWNGVVPQGGGSVTITVNAIINPGHESETISNQATLLFDADANGTNETAVLSNDPSTGAANDATAFVVFVPIPTSSTLGLMLLALLMAAVALKVARG
jgi:uncharacterized repeat protein (TIGR01451 family)